MIGELGSVPSGPRNGRAGLSGAEIVQDKQNFRFVMQLRSQQTVTDRDRPNRGPRRSLAATTGSHENDPVYTDPRGTPDRACVHRATHALRYTLIAGVAIPELHPTSPVTDRSPITDHRITQSASGRGIRYPSAETRADWRA